MTKLPDRLLVAQITDIHLFADPEQSLLGIKTEESYRAILAAIEHLDPQPDVLLLTGDLTQDADRKAYLRLKDSLAHLQLPTYWLPGNHDEVELMQDLQGDLSDGAVFMDKRVEMNGWQLLLLNSAMPQQVHGCLTAECLAWLDRQLANYPEMPTLIALHHPALPLGSAWIDRISLHNQAEFWQVCDRHANLKVVVSGHAHQEFDTIRSRVDRQVRFLVTPSTCIQFQPNNDEFQLDTQAPGYRLLRLDRDGTVETTVHRLAHAKFQPNLAAVGY